MFDIRGKIDSVQYNPMLGTPYPKQSAYCDFVALVSEKTWKITITSTNRPDWWVEFCFDGTNSYTIEPDATGYFSGRSAQTNLLQVNIMPSSFYQPAVSDPLGVSISWFTFGMFGQMLKTNNLGFIVFPAPWTHPRNNPFSYGFRWDISYGPDARFVDSCEMIREQGLDSNDETEMFEPELDYPETVADYNSYLLSLKFRQSMLTGWQGASFKTLAWFKTNGIAIPAETELKIFEPNLVCQYPLRIIHLKVSDIQAASGSDTVTPEISVKADVDDYRYKKSGNGRIFKYANCSLIPGEAWKTRNDVSLLSQADNWLDHGRKTKDWVAGGKTHETWIILLIIPAIAAVLWLCWKKRHKGVSS